MNLAVGRLGRPFKQPGAYRIEASYRNLDGGTAAAVMRLYVRPADYDSLPTIHDLFDARVGRVLAMGGTRVMEDVLQKLDAAIRQLGSKHPACFKLRQARAGAFAQAFKVIDLDAKAVRLLEPDPEFVVRELEPVIDQPERAADSLGHIPFRDLVNTYSECALEAGKRAKARAAQKDLVALLKVRKVVPSAIERAEERLKELA